MNIRLGWFLIGTLVGALIVVIGTAGMADKMDLLEESLKYCEENLPRHEHCEVYTRPINPKYKTEMRLQSI